MLSLPFPTAFDKFFAFGPLGDLADDDALSTLLGRVSFDGFSALGTFQDSALNWLPHRHRGHPRVSSSTREELEAFIRASFAGPTAEKLNTLFPVFDETLKVQHGGPGEFRLCPSGWATAHGVPMTCLRACARTSEPNFSRCSTATLCCPFVPFRMTPHRFP